jgi:hypothetical protein
MCGKVLLLNVNTHKHKYNGATLQEWMGHGAYEYARKKLEKKKSAVLSLHY